MKKYTYYILCKTLTDTNIVQYYDTACYVNLPIHAKSFNSVAAAQTFAEQHRIEYDEIRKIELLEYMRGVK
jgi:hypothetical protein